MSPLVLFLLALALAMDALAVSICSGALIEGKKIRNAVKMAFFFGFFQAVMPVAGWYAGRVAAEFIRSYDHWVAFSILCFIGFKMLYESFFFEKECRKRTDPFKSAVLFTLAIATSIDAAAVGVSLSLLESDIIRPALVIGAVTFCMSFAGTRIGRQIGVFFGKKVEIAGGLILIGIGCKILMEHLLS